ncbi:MAG: YihY/virulence factor BrkB family protein [Acidobacteria bacterium]|nr:YihY/virulence factor BrkB family protein [Acidobacteriota bacterium]
MTKTLIERFSEKTGALLPLFRYLVLQTETHAFCGSLAFFALLAFYPFSFLLLSWARYAMRWGTAYTVIADALRDYYPTGQDFLVRNLEFSVVQYGRQIELHSIVWVLLGAAGFFIPLEAAFNRLWKFPQDRPYWKNQLVGFLLTAACCGLAFLFVLLTAALHTLISRLLVWDLLGGIFRYAALKISTILYSFGAIFLFYKFLPNGRVRSAQVLPAAVLAGVAAEVVRWLYLQVLPFLQIQKSQGPYYVSISFALLAYFEAFVLLGGAFLASGSEQHPWLALRFLRRRARLKDRQASDL